MKNIFSLLCLLLFLTPVPSIAGSESSLSSLSWRWTSEVNGSPIAQLVDSQTNQATTIFFRWNADGALTSSQAIDEKIQVIAALPERNLWEAHPGQGQSVQAFFLNSARNLGFSLIRQPYLTQEKGNWNVRPFSESLKALKVLDAPNSINSHVENIRKEIFKTRRELIQNLLSTNEKLSSALSWVTEAFDIVQPVKTENSNEARFDAFNLLATREYTKNPAKFLSILQRVSDQSSWNPIDWFWSESNATENQKLALISLVTHNHIAERNFVQSVTLVSGVDEGWRVSMAINKLYAAEKKYWGTNTGAPRVRENSSLNLLFPPTQISFLDEQRSHEVNMRTGSQMCKPHPGQYHWIPLVRTYHFYGGFITARLLKQRHLPDNAIRWIVRFLGSQYKIVSATKDFQQLKMIDDIYTQAGFDALSCQPADQLNAPKDHLAIFISGRRLPSVLGQISEAALAQNIKYRIGSRYRRIHIWLETSGRNPIQFLRDVQTSAGADEHLDVISVQHGPDESFVPSRSAQEVESTIRPGFIRNLLTTGCSMWGDLYLVDGDWVPRWRSAFGLHMRRLQVKSYTLFANNTTHWWKIAQELTTRLSPSSDWTIESIDYFDQIQTQSLRYEKKNTSKLGVFASLAHPISSGRPIFGVRSHAPTFLSETRVKLLMKIGEDYQEFQLRMPSPVK
jgi:hypothetical protein